MDAAIHTINDTADIWARCLWPVLWQSAVLAGVVWLVTRAPRMPAALRFWLWMLIPLRLLVMPALTVPLPLLPVAEPVGSEQLVQDVTPVGGLLSLDALDAVANATDSAAALRSLTAPAVAVQPVASAARPTVYALLMTSWIVGATVFAIRLLRGWMKIHGVVARCRAATDSTVIDAARQAAGMLGMTRLPALLITEEHGSPFVHGVFRPVVVLPRAFVEQATADQLIVVLTHELAHLRRRDPLAGWAMAICQAIYFFHPPFYVARHFLLLERETACDESVLASNSIGAAAYARTLIDAAASYGLHGRRAPQLAVAAESFARLKSRLVRLTGGLQPAARISAPAALTVLAFSIVAIPGITLTEAAAPPASQETHSVTVLVRQPDGSGIDGAKLEVISGFRPIAQGCTDESGEAELAIPAHLPVQWVVALKPGDGLDYYEFIGKEHDLRQRQPLAPAA